ncbi:MAG: hypothetical protein NTX52_07110 [Planctomycetota bacterium]|nr:hypothetical protein [Planctomycetota bacterium]
MAVGNERRRMRDERRGTGFRKLAGLNPPNPPHEWRVNSGGQVSGFPLSRE